LVTLAEAVELKPFYSSSTLLALRDESPRLIQEALPRQRRGESALYCIYVKSGRGYLPAIRRMFPNEEGIRTLRAALQAYARKEYRDYSDLDGLAQRRRSPC
jgi:hypothetical protein